MTKQTKFSTQRKIILYKYMLVISIASIWCSYSHSMTMISKLFGFYPKTIFEAIETDNYYAFRELLREDSSLLYKTCDTGEYKGWTLLLMACDRGNPQICEFIIEKSVGKEISSKNDSGETPLHLIAKHKIIEGCKCLLRHGANASALDDHGWTPLHHAARHGQAYIAYLLIFRGKANCNAADNDRRETPLHVAAEHNHASVIRELISQGADIKLGDAYGFTPLIVAAEYLKSAACEALLEKGAQLNARSSNTNHSALYFAQDRYVKGCSYLNDQDKAMRNDLCELLVTRCRNLNEQNENGEALIHEAAALDHEYMANLLVKRNADINIQNKLGETPLMISIKNNATRPFTLLLNQSSLRKELRDDVIKGTALHYACVNGKTAFCKQMLEKGFDADAKAQGETLLHMACKIDNLELVELLLGYQNDLEAPDKNGDRPIHIVCNGNKEKALRKLFLKKIDLDAVNGFGKTPLHLAIERGHVNIVTLLLTNGSDPMKSTTQVIAPLLLAAHYKSVKCCKALLSALTKEQINQVKPSLMIMIRGHNDLENLFGTEYHSLNLIPVYDGALQTQERVESLQDNNAIDTGYGNSSPEISGNKGSNELPKQDSRRLNFPHGEEEDGISNNAIEDQVSEEEDN